VCQHELSDMSRNSTGKGRHSTDFGFMLYVLGLVSLALVLASWLMSLALPSVSLTPSLMSCNVRTSLRHSTQYTPLLCVHTTNFTVSNDNVLLLIPGTLSLFTLKFVVLCDLLDQCKIPRLSPTFPGFPGGWPS